MNTTISYAIALSSLFLTLPTIAATNNNQANQNSSSPPTVVRKLAKLSPAPIPVFGSVARARCPLNDSGWPLSSYCFVVKYQGLTYWPMSFDDNRYAILAAGYDDNKKLVKYVYACGTRYIWAITIDDTNKNAIFWGQASQNNPTSTAIPWNLLQNNSNNEQTCPLISPQ
ncbi:hypothetical protein [Burkholderia ambifaria]|uniref:hypothetical protein n=1 Tax=Burkholderia ambifaria TaxID=152480 RepID=UPI00158EB0F2|nr:hypothetical protein [Burkholderia ambifaria]MBR8332556.1 hypothetical protein [Burkholderia ambifaria]MBR8342832.1 hypothetical protein [Burkholderia ambifaria]